MTAIIMSYSGLNESCGSVFTRGPGLDSEVMQTKAKKQKYDQSMTGISTTQITEIKRDITKLIWKKATKSLIKVCLFWTISGKFEEVFYLVHHGISCDVMIQIHSVVL